MATLFTITHEAGNLSEYTANSGGNITADAAAALHGNYGLKLNIVDATVLYAYKTATKAAQFRYRFYFDPNSITMANNNVFTFGDVRQGAAPSSQFIRIDLKYTDAAGYTILIYGKDDSTGSPLTDYVNITDAPHCIEVHAVSATSDVAADGSYEWWVDGVSQGSVASIDNYNLMQDQNWRIYGARVDGIDAGTSGVIYLDDIQVNNDGSEIGLISSGIAIPVILNQFRMRRE